MENSNDFATGLMLGENRNGNWGNNGMFGMEWLFALLLLPSITNGDFFGNGRNGNAVTETAMCNANSFNELKSSVGRGFDQQTSFAFQNQRDLCEVAATLSAQIAAAAAAQERCCCETKGLIQQTQYENAKNTADINANTTEKVQSVLDAICGLRMEMKDAQNAQLLQRVNQLEMQQLMCGVVRYPNQTTYGAGFNPFFNNGCGCGSCGNGNI